MSWLEIYIDKRHRLPIGVRFIGTLLLVLAGNAAAAEQTLPGYTWQELGDGIYLHSSANTDGDVVVWLPDDDLLITGDLLVAPVPFAFDSPMRDWVATLERVRDIGAGTIVPGHGAVQTENSYLEQVLVLLKATLDEVNAAHNRGAGLEELVSEVDLGEFEARFIGNDPEKTFAWNSYYLSPGLKSAWASLGFEVPDGD